MLRPAPLRLPLVDKVQVERLQVGVGRLQTKHRGQDVCGAAGVQHVPRLVQHHVVLQLGHRQGGTGQQGQDVGSETWARGRASSTKARAVTKQRADAA